MLNTRSPSLELQSSEQLAQWVLHARFLWPYIYNFFSDLTTDITLRHYSQPCYAFNSHHWHVSTSDDILKVSRFDRDSRDTERYDKHLRPPNLSAADRLARHPNACRHVYPPSYAMQHSRYPDGYRYSYTTSDTPQVCSCSRSRPCPRYEQTSKDLEPPRSGGGHDSYRDFADDNAHRTLTQPSATGLGPDAYKWACSQCTLYNPGTHDFCSICGIPRTFGLDYPSHSDQNNYKAHLESSMMTYDDPYPAPREPSALDSRPRPSSFVQSDGPDRPRSPDLRHESARRSGGMPVKTRVRKTVVMDCMVVFMTLVVTPVDLECGTCRTFMLIIGTELYQNLW